MGWLGDVRRGDAQECETPMKSDDVTTWPSPLDRRRLAPRVLAAFVLTFIAARIVVYLIMTHALPNLYLYVGATHVHRLNYGVFLLAAVGAYLIFRQPEGRRLRLAADAYGVGLGLTFDEFGMWLHLGGSYGQRASFDAMVVISGLPGLIALAPSLNRFRPRHWAVAMLLMVATIGFVTLLVRSVWAVEQKSLLHLEQLDAPSPY